MQINNIEDLMLQIMYKFAEDFGAKAILKGGMELRLLDCPRYTNDLDYVFSPFASKKDILEDVLKSLNKIKGIKIDYSINSKCIRIYCLYSDIKLQVEINVSSNCESQELSTSSLAKQNNQLVRIIRVMKFEIAFSNKLAAWNERRLIRDLYDCYFMNSILKINLDLPTLTGRLNKIESRIKNFRSIKKMSIIEFTNVLVKEIENINQNTITLELRDYLKPEELPGLDLKIKKSIYSIIEFLNKK